jgi:hypothetical protein
LTGKEIAPLAIKKTSLRSFFCALSPWLLLEWHRFTAYDELVGMVTFGFLVLEVRAILIGSSSMLASGGPSGS